jgi:hypothetical protein
MVVGHYELVFVGCFLLLCLSVACTHQVDEVIFCFGYYNYDDYYDAYYDAYLL